MPPQPGIFALPYPATHGKARVTSYSSDMNMQDDMMIPVYPHQQHSSIAGPSSRAHGFLDDPKREKKRKELSGKLGKEIIDRRDDGRHFGETVGALISSAQQLSMRPDTHPLYILRLYPLSLERSAILAQLEAEEKHSMDCLQVAYDEEREKVEEEWKRGRERVRERLMEGIEERRRRAREEKEGEGTVGDASLDLHSRPPITRKLRNKLGTSPPPTPLGQPGLPASNGGGLISSLPITTGPFLNPHSLAVDELPSPFPLPLTATSVPIGGSAAGGSGAAGGTSGRRRPKGGGQHPSQTIGGLGKAISMITQAKDNEVENDLGEIRRGNKRRRAAAASLAKTSI